MPRGLVSHAAAFALRNERGEVFASDSRILDRWSDGSARWVLVDALLNAESSGRLHLVFGEQGNQEVEHRLRITGVEEGHLIVDTGVITAQLIAGGAWPLVSVKTSSGPLLAERGGEISAIDGEIGKLPVRFETLTLEDGALVGSVNAVGWAGEGENELRLTLRLTFHAGSASVGCVLTVHNPRPARHPGGIWQLGDEGSRLLSHLGVNLFLGNSGEWVGEFWEAPEQEPRRVSQRLRLDQLSSGGDAWRSPVHLNRAGRVPHDYRGYRLEIDGKVDSGSRAEPIVRASAGERQLVLAVPNCWQEFPKSLVLEKGRVELGLWPDSYGDLHELQGGEQKSHRFYLCFGEDRVSSIPLAWRLRPLAVVAEPSWTATTGVLPGLVPEALDPCQPHRALALLGVEGPGRFVLKRERIDEYGWRHFGDVYADHETVFHRGDQPLVSHYNNQYDAILAFLHQYLRTADPRWWELGRDLTRHVADIDIYHTDGDSPAYNHGLFWHTVHYVNAGISSHRSYPRGTSGGGPGPEHIYARGLALYHHLTGDPLAREATLELAQWVVDMEDGSKTRFGWLDGGPTGWVSQTHVDPYHGPGRAPGNALSTLLVGAALGAGPATWNLAEELVERCIHPADDLAARKLDNPEVRWSYTVFLVALGEYLEAKLERGELDHRYGYARAALLHYANWMVENEYYYLDRPELLEFPNETWTAQELRKSDVLALAALYSRDEGERSQFVQRAREIRDRSLRELHFTPKRSLTRVLILTLRHGSLLSYIDLNPDERRPEGPVGLDFGAPREFFPQEDRVLRRVPGLPLVMSVLRRVARMAGSPSVSEWRPLRLLRSALESHRSTDLRR